MHVTQKIRTFLWFDKEAEEAAQFYCSLFPGSCILDMSRYGESGPNTLGAVMVVTFELAGTHMMAMNGGPYFKFTEAISLSVDCVDQAEVDHLWEALGAGGTYSQCGWLKDRYGLSWQIVPSRLPQLMTGADTAGRQRTMQAMMKMSKLDIAALEAAYTGT